MCPEEEVRVASSFVALLPILGEVRAYCPAVQLDRLDWFLALCSVRLSNLWVAFGVFFFFYLRTTVTSWLVTGSSSLHKTHFPTTCKNEGLSHTALSVTYHINTLTLLCFSSYCSFALCVFLFSLYFPLHLLSCLGCLWTKLIVLSLACLCNTVGTSLNTNVSPVLRLEYNSCVLL